MTSYVPQDVFGVATIPEALECAARAGAGITIVDRTLAETAIRYGELADVAGRAAAGLRAAGVAPGDRVCLLSPTTLDLLVALFGAWHLGAVPVVLPLPRRQSDLPAYVEDVRTRVEVSGATALAVSAVFLAQGVSFEDVDARTIPLETLATSADRSIPPARSLPDDLALLQFTSGTTAASRAVALTHDNILSNLAAAGSTAGLGHGDVVVSWLPLFHDMGLIGMLLGAVAFGIPLVLSPTEEFLARPGSWLDAISAYRGTLTAAPNFGYGLAARDLANRPRPLDLSAWRVAANGAETVDMDTVNGFAIAASTHGFRREAMCPMFGLAESTLAVTLSSAADPVHVEWVARAELETRGQVRWAAPDDPGAKPLVSCGHPIPGTELKIADRSGQPLPPGTVGEICVRGPSVMHGYWRAPEATDDTLRDGWLHTGDLGFWASDGIVVCGRSKDMIILGGRNLYPEDYEFWTERVPGVRRGNVIAFALPEFERMVVVAETTVGPDDAQIVARETLETLRRRLPRGPEEVVLVQAGTLPKTSSGKRQRGACRDRYEAGELITIATAKR